MGGLSRRCFIPRGGRAPIHLICINTDRNHSDGFGVRIIGLQEGGGGITVTDSFYAAGSCHPVSLHPLEIVRQRPCARLPESV